MDGNIINIVILLGLILFPLVAKALFKEKNNDHKKAINSTENIPSDPVHSDTNSTLNDLLSTLFESDSQINIKQKKQEYYEENKNMEDLQYENIDAEINRNQTEVFSYEKLSEKAFHKQKSVAFLEEQNDRETEGVEINNFLEEFDLQKAFVYSQILDTPRFKQV